MDKARFLGVSVTPMTVPEIIEKIDEIISINEKLLISHHNLHSVYLNEKDEKMSAFYQKANYTYIDGMALVLLGRMLGVPLQRKHRITLVDWLYPLLNVIHKNKWKVYYLGSTKDVVDKAASVLQKQYPDLLLKTHHGYFDVHREGIMNQSILADIRQYRPHVLFVGMGMPRQEKWVLENYDEIHAHAVLTAGACLDYFAEAIPTPPRWMGRIGLEWLFRLCSEPKRLWKRYLVEPWFVLGMLIVEILFRKKGEIET